MKSVLLDERDRLRTYALVLQMGDEAAKAIADFATAHRLGGSHFTAIGAFSRAVVGLPSSSTCTGRASARSGRNSGWPTMGWLPELSMGKR